MQEGREKDYFESNDGAVRVWIEQESSIQIKAVTPRGDPVELSESEALELAEILKNFASRV
ncbi:hypothetical protein [Caballeronia sp. ATUFL_M2_KS44]|uniref:hypothetical protein n=1 Tax=Caballeronia sp. ATUFL_M2_KS44 TaxID=2921767 RepID=UPI002027F8FF|nr:hypothetical protein [Caballeronia sp. ATUFL_M2_KS44]